MAGFWTDNPGFEERLPVLWDEGLSTAEIGRRLGCSKNSVVIKAHRLDLPKRPSPIVRGDDPAKRTGHVAKRAPKVTLPSLAPVAQPIEVPALAAPKPKPAPRPAAPPAQQPAAKYRGTCQWPIGEPGTPSFRFCDAPALAGMPYCEKCAEKAYPLFRERRRSQSAAA